MKKGILYIVATPIGNLEDITLRALRVLKEVALIAAEDTRRTRKLLNAYGIKTPVTSLYDQNELAKSASIISRLEEGEDIAYVSDAGTPGISDPGYILITRAIEHSIKVMTVPGPVAAIAALSISGLPMDSFAFYAFLPSRLTKRRQFLESLRDETKTMIFYESPRRLASALNDIYTILGDRKMVLSRELTKLYEETIRGTVSEVLKIIEGTTVKGEITLILSGAQKKSVSDQKEAIKETLQVLREDPRLTTRDIVDRISEELSLSRKEVYQEVLKLLGS
ncbi:MAG: 16S rRNA (cytidine(1402)-2'-O)-methyltransferase [Deltaproteobacteria bacterium]|jgi:16S rRNA (cytidine1402-2'-O)-methyltransferase|nr:16S rRNA (cytidine(1402)-2'-O)-methyltransferase [Deltaproteobacteria bacterium]